ncbi:uncharacterized protein AB675_11906 [Cyphellophora attinorum]|uniref:Uncharacterized protein n=1 Tax=Cyphellophora attinorum TaxID=1664694 RepID=A0A0N1NXI5_9EURO|nr:uncharacterized protein AB675_11906 [Phialophora attinorum]KPI34967.1 hypothetical protein AB675_11906 [Phialophora attinorum]
MAANIGVNAGGHASLDYRLRDGWEARKVTIDLLQSLQDHANRAIELAQSNNGSSWVTQIVESPHAVSETATSTTGVLSSFAGTETESLNELLELEPYEQHVRGVEQAIDRLYRVSLAIRQASMLGPSEAAAKAKMRDEYGNDTEAAFEHTSPPFCPIACQTLSLSFSREWPKPSLFDDGDSTTEVGISPS